MKRAEKGLLRKQILTILSSTPKARDSDQYLTLCIWNRFYPTRIFNVEKTTPEGKIIKEKAIRLIDIMEMPREDNIKRIRAIIQNEEKLFLPTSLEVAKQRKIEENDWRAYIKQNHLSTQ